MKASKWLFLTIIITCAAICALGVIAFIVDPYMHYRMTYDKYFLRSNLVTAGIIKNHDYDAVLIGSSMVQNFQMDSFREKLQSNPIKVTMGGIKFQEVEKMVELVNAANKCRKMFIGVDFYLFTQDGHDESRFPDYLSDNNVLNDYKYLLGYETWMRFMPIDLVFYILPRAGIKLPPNFSDKTAIDKLDEWQHHFSFGREEIIKNYSSSVRETSTPDIDDLYGRMTAKIDDYIAIFDFNNGDREYVFFFPPYSALFWHTSKVDKYFDVYMMAKAYIVEKLSEAPNVSVFDFQSIPQICDLDNYKDSTHYIAEINEFMVDCFKLGEYKTTKETIGNNIRALEIMVKQFEIENSDWLK